MKKNIGSQLALYPMPVTVVGEMNGDKPTWTLVAHVGIIGHDRGLVSLAVPHFINAALTGVFRGGYLQHAGIWELYLYD